MEDAGARGLGDRGEVERLGFVLLNVFPGFLNEWRLRVLPFQNDLIDQRGQLLGEKAQESNRRAVFFLGNDRSHFPGLAQRARKSYSACLESRGRAALVGLDR